ncbi:helix-turn-helix domain-containing protein [Corynebacterium mastitidis]|uniref:helix-turn-helix domain-containing protein n=1 Tax=Corynebacterium mastitidis TaxID=161890 RepID=UPI003CC7C9E0
MTRLVSEDGLPLISANEAATHLGRHPDTVRTMMRRGDLRAEKPAGRWYTTKQWCDEYVMNGAVA